MRWPLDTWRQLRERTTIDPVERNPDRDITPPRAYCIQLGTHREGDPEPRHPTTAFVYAPSGRCMGTLSASTLAGLKAQHTHSAEDSFEKATALLLQRYPPERNNAPKATGRNNITPPALMAALSEACGGPHMLAERFASPLDRSPHAHTYWSKHSEDRAFGANHNAYSVPWVGFSVAHPGTEPEEVGKAMRWAIASAENTTTPTCTFLLAPQTQGQPYHQHLEPGLRHSHRLDLQPLAP